MFWWCLRQMIQDFETSIKVLEGSIIRLVDESVFTILSLTEGHGNTTSDFLYWLKCKF